jgi:hypothetical protein
MAVQMGTTRNVATAGLRQCGGSSAFMIPISMSQPARKKQKLSTENILHSGCSIIDCQSNNSNSHLHLTYSFAANAFQHQVLTEELDLEIALRERLAATLEFRVAWALILQKALTNDTNTTSQYFNWQGHRSGHSLDRILSADSTPGEFEDAAVEATETIETPCSIIFSREASPPQTIHELLEHASRASVSNEQSKFRSRKSRTPRTPGRPQGPKFLFIRNTNVSPPTVAKMVCPDCGRSEFTNLQGLLNHARLRHKRDYGSHDECMQNCAVIIDSSDGEEEADWVNNGIELSGVSLPSLRRLFEIAVGDDKGIIDGLVAGKEENDEDADVISSTYLSKTLGHHKDTPALAPFLGRAPKRRCINVYNEDEEVNIVDSKPLLKSPDSWRMSFPHRNDARPELDVIIESTPTTEPPTHIQPSIQLAGLPSNTSGTRFHIIARVVVSDRSVWIPPGNSHARVIYFKYLKSSLCTDRRPQPLPDHTHRWVIEVVSPSYVSLLSPLYYDIIFTNLQF